MPRKMTICLTPGSIGVKANQQETIQLAHDFGFESVEPYPVELAAMGPRAAELNAKRQELKLEWGQAGLPIDFRKDEDTFLKDLKAFPAHAAALRAAGARRIGTWIAPNHDTLPYLANLRQHASRLRKVASILADNELRLGLEYVGPKTLWSAKRYPFIHSMNEMRELLSEINSTQIGFVLDTWHWYTAGESTNDLKSLSNDQIVCLDLNDAPAGIPIDQQIDNKREIPMSTGVIDIGAFLNALHDLGCDAPARCEPFNAELRARPREEILATVAASMKKAMQLVKT